VEMLAFIGERFHRYRRQKTQVDQWDSEGLKVKRLADSSRGPAEFVGDALRLMGIDGYS